MESMSMSSTASSTAAKFHPYLVYLLGFEVALLGLALAFGAFLLLKHFLKKRPFDGSPAVENKEIARQVQEEILRLVELRNRIDPSLANLEPGKIAQGQVGTPAAGSTPDIKILEEKFQNEVKGFQEKIAALETALKSAQEAAAKGAENPAEGSAAQASSGGASADEIQKIKDESAQAKVELEQQVVHLETVVSEYRIFEEDFALVKKFKGENDQLREEIAQLKARAEAMPTTPPVTSAPAPVQASPAKPAEVANSELSEQDITSLFQSFDMPGEGAETSLAAQTTPASTPEDFDPIAALAAQPDPDPLAELAAAAPPPAADPAPSTPADANEIEAFFKAQDEAAGSSGNDADALLAELHAAAANSPAPTEAPLNETPAPARPTEGYEMESVRQEPEVSLTALSKNESLEDLAESAAGDDKLMEEFQKVLETEKAG